MKSSSASRWLPVVLASLVVGALGAAPAQAEGVPELPDACAKRTQYVTGYWWVKDEACLTEQNGKPDMRFWIECQEYAYSPFWRRWKWDVQSCWADVSYTLSKNGEPIAQGDRHFWSTRRGHDIRIPYQCDGPGQYSLKVDFQSGDGQQDEDRVTVHHFNVQDKGC